MERNERIPLSSLNDMTPWRFSRCETQPILFSIFGQRPDSMRGSDNSCPAVRTSATNQAHLQAPRVSTLFYKNLSTEPLSAPVAQLTDALTCVRQSRRTCGTGI